MTQQTATSGDQTEPSSTEQQPRQMEPVEKAQRQNRRLEMWFVVLLATVYLAWFAWPLVWSASANVRLVGTFNTDEQAHVVLLKEAIESRPLRVGYIQYGYAYLNMGLVPLLLLSFVTKVSEQHIIVWLRVIPTLFSIATVVMTFCVARRFFDRLTAWLSALFLSFTVLNFLRMSAMSHSDIPQVFFIVAGVYFCSLWTQDGRLNRLVLASVSAGLAFGCKYSGLFLLPVFGLYGILWTVRMDESQVNVDRGRVIGAGRTLCALAGVASLVVGLVIVPRISTSYAGEEYFGVPMESFFDSLRVLVIVAGAGAVLLAVLPFIWAFVRSRPRLTYLFMLGMVTAIAFFVAFMLSSPFHVFSVRSGFVRGFLYESLHSSFGHSFEASDSRLEWFRVLSAPELVNPLILGLAAVSLTLTAYKVKRLGWQQLLEPESVLWVWTLGYLVFLIWRVKIRTHRALLPVVPFLLILAAHTIGQLVRYLKARLPRRPAMALAVVGLLIVVIVVFPGSLERALEFRRTTSTLEQTSEAVSVGHWLQDRYPPSTRVVYDPYVYVPPTFVDAFVTPWGGTLQMLDSLQPDIVIVDHLTLNRFSDIQQADKYVRDKAHFLKKYRYYAALKSGEHGYVLVRDFGKIQVYAKTASSRNLLTYADLAVGLA